MYFWVCLIATIEFKSWSSVNSTNQVKPELEYKNNMAAMGRFVQFVLLNEFMEDEYELSTNDEQNIIVFAACNS